LRTFCERQGKQQTGERGQHTTHNDIRDYAFVEWVPNVSSAGTQGRQLAGRQKCVCSNGAIFGEVAATVNCP